MAEPIAALIVRILADTSEMVTGVKNVSGQLDALESKVGKFGKAVAGYFTVQAIASFVKEIVSDMEQIDAAAKRLGTSSEEVQRFAYAIKQSGGDVEGATTAIMSLTDKLGSGDAGLFNVLRKLNVNLDEFKAKDAVTRFVDLAIAINGVSDPTKQLELRLEALGLKGVAALTAVTAEHKNLADNAPIYTDAQIASVKRAGDAWDDFLMRVKISAAGAIDVFKETKRWMSMGAFGEAVDTTLLRDPNMPNAPKSPGRALPGELPAAPIDPNNVKQLAVAEADLALQATQAAAAQRELKDAFDATNFILKTLKMEMPSLAAAMQPLMAAFDTSTKVENMTKRILDLAMRSMELRKEQERLLEVLNPGSTKVAGDDVDAELFKLRSDSQNFGKDGNLNAQALQIEHDLINNFSLKLLANSMAPAAMPSAAFGNTPGFASVVNPPSITINAQGSYLSDPDSLNRLARLVGDQLAKREGFNSAFSRR